MVASLSFSAQLTQRYAVLSRLRTSAVLQVRELIVNVHLCCVYTGNLVSGVVAVATAKDRATDSQVIGNCPHSSLSFVIRAFIVLQSVGYIM